MSKYIRTKDGRVESWNIYNKDLDMVEYLSQFANYQGDYAVIAQADTIEELCDGFFLKIYGNDFSRDATGSRDTFKQFKETYLFYKNHEKCDGFGFIETDKGLIYVAKLNDKGELELI